MSTRSPAETTEVRSGAETAGQRIVKLVRRIDDLEAALTEYLEATASVFEIDPVSKRNWAELDPLKSDECLARFQRLDAAGKRARAALHKAEGK